MWPGYKQTEAGVIPEDWDATTLGDLFEITAGGDFRKDRSSHIQDESHQHPIYSNALSRQGLYGFCDYADHEADSITITARGTIGVANYRDHAFTAIGRVLVLRPKGRIFTKFISDYINHRIIFAVESTGVPQLTAPQVSKYFCALPPKYEEQEAIAAALSDVDGLLVGLDRLIAKKRAVKTAVMQQLLTGEVRVGEGGNGRWETVRLGDVCQFYSGGTPSTSNRDYYNGNIPWITSSDVNKKQIFSVEGKISKKGFDSSSTKMILANTLLIALYGATAGEIAISRIEAAINQAVLAVIPDESLSVEFLFHKLQLLKENIVSTYTQGGQPNLSGAIVKSIELSVPDIQEQHAIAAILADIDAEIAALAARRAKTAAIKQGMMQELLTGRTRLVDS